MSKKLSEELVAAIPSEAQAEAVLEGLDEFCARIEATGVDSMILNTVLLTIYCERMAYFGDRDLFEEQVSEALETPWDEHTVH